MKAKTTLTWLENLAFEAEIDGFSLILDANPEKDKNVGPRPKKLLLAALSGCSGMDTVSILKKMRIEDFKLRINMEAESTTEHPKTYHTIHMIFDFTGDNLPQEKVINAVELSITRYCGVYAMLKNSAKIITTININEQEVWNA